MSDIDRSSLPAPTGKPYFTESPEELMALKGRGIIIGNKQITWDPPLWLKIPIWIFQYVMLFTAPLFLACGILYWEARMILGLCGALGRWGDSFRGPQLGTYQVRPWHDGHKMALGGLWNVSAGAGMLFTGLLPVLLFLPLLFLVLIGLPFSLFYQHVLLKLAKGNHFKAMGIWPWFVG